MGEPNGEPTASVIIDWLNGLQMPLGQRRKNESGSGTVERGAEYPCHAETWVPRNSVRLESRIGL